RQSPPEEKQHAEFSEKSECVNGRKTIASRQRCDLYAVRDHESVRHHEKSAVRFACLCGNDGFKFGGIVDGCEYYLHCEGRSGSLKGLQPKFGKCRHCGIEQNGDPGDPRRNLLEQFQPLAGLRRFRNGETGSVAAWSVEARDETTSDRIGNNPKNDGDGARFLEQRRGGWGALRKKKIGL